MEECRFPQKWQKFVSAMDVPGLCLPDWTAFSLGFSGLLIVELF